MCVFAQYQDKIDAISAKVVIHPEPITKNIKGTVTYLVHIKEDVDSLYFDARTMRFSKVLVNTKTVPYTVTPSKIVLQKKFAKGESYTITLAYAVRPKQAVYFMDWTDDDSGNDQIWTQGQGKYTSHWLPSFDDMNEKLVFNISVVFNKDYTVIANGKLEKRTSFDSNRDLWEFEMQQPMSSYLVAFVIGKYQKQTLFTQQNIPVELYYYPQDSAKVAPTYRHTIAMFDFLEKEIGVAYPWQNYKQVPVKDFLYAGMENTGTTIFSDSYMIDEVGFTDKKYTNVNAHELAHQWFGNLVTETSGTEHWLHEGFATYYALLAEAEVLGTEYALWKLYRTARELKAMSNAGRGEELTNAGASSITFYEKGAWALVALREQLGTAVFQKGIREFLSSYRFKNATINNFMTMMEKVSGSDLANFKATWLTAKEFPYARAKKYLSNNSATLATVFDLEQKLQKNTPIANQELLIANYRNTTSENLKTYILKNYVQQLPSDFLLQCFEEKNLAIRQTLSNAFQTLPEGFQSKFKTLLYDQSYITQENALYTLWVNYPEDRRRYLDTMKTVVGSNAKSIRLMWLAFALATPEYNEEYKQLYFEELTGYTDRKYHFEVRQRAFEWLKNTVGFTNANLGDLVAASQHHTWQFRKYARALLRELIKDSNYSSRLQGLEQNLTDKERDYITNLIKQK